MTTLGWSEESIENAGYSSVERGAYRIGVGHVTWFVDKQRGKRIDATEWEKVYG
jgi:hypothetical protein